MSASIASLHCLIREHPSAVDPVPLSTVLYTSIPSLHCLVHSDIYQTSTYLEEVPRIWEGEGYWRSKILNPVDNDHWVCLARSRPLLDRRAQLPQKIPEHGNRFWLDPCPDAREEFRVPRPRSLQLRRSSGPSRELTCRFSSICFPMFRTFLGDFNLQKLPSRSLQTLWEWKNRVVLEEYYIFNVAIPLGVE